MALTGLPTMHAPQVQFLTIRDIAQRLKLSPSSVYQLVETGRLAHHRIGTGRGAIRVSEADLLNFLQQCHQQGTEKPAVRQASRPRLKHIRL